MLWLLHTPQVSEREQGFHLPSWRPDAVSPEQEPRVEHTGVSPQPSPPGLHPHCWELAGLGRVTACEAQRPAEESRREAPGTFHTPQHSTPLLLTTRGSSGLLPSSSGPGVSKLSCECRGAEPAKQPLLGIKNPFCAPQRENPSAQLCQLPTVYQAREDQREVRPKPGLRTDSQGRGLKRLEVLLSAEQVVKE